MTQNDIKIKYLGIDDALSDLLAQDKIVELANELNIILE